MMSNGPMTNPNQPTTVTPTRKDYDLTKLTRLIGNGVDEGPGFHTLMAMSANCHAGATRLLDVWTRIALEACEVEG